MDIKGDFKKWDLEIKRMVEKKQMTDSFYTNGQSQRWITYILKLCLLPHFEFINSNQTQNKWNWNFISAVKIIWWITT